MVDWGEKNEFLVRTVVASGKTPIKLFHIKAARFQGVSSFLARGL